MQKIVTFLTFDNQAEQAMKFYTSVFRNSKILSTMKYPDGVPNVGGNIFGGSLEIEGQIFNVLNGGPQFKMEMGMSLFVNCMDQQEIDYYWEKLGEGGEYSMCGWLKDQFGVWWQVVPYNMGELLKSRQAVDAMMRMRKIDIGELNAASK